MKKLMGIWALCAVSGAVGACSSSTQAGTPMTTADAVSVSALSQGEDGSDETATDATEDAPSLDQDCSFGSIRKQVIAKFDTNGDGKLDASELAAIGDDSGVTVGKVHRSLNRAHVMRQHRVAYLHWLYDANGDGKLDATESMQLQADLEQRCQNRKTELLTKFDANHDGMLDTAEWKAAALDLAKRFAARKAELLAKFDTNGDGKLDVLERFEARQAVRDRMEAKLDALKKEYDTNHDGKLDADELMSLRDYLKSRVRGEQFLMP